MKTHQKIYLGVTGAILTTLLIVPSLAASNHTPAPAGDPVKVEKPAPVAVKVEKPAPVPVKVASVSTTGFGFSAAANDLKMTVDQVLEIVTDDNLRKDDRSRKMALRKVIGQRFDFSKMARHTLENDWNNRSSQEKQQFIRLFKKLLEKSYLHIIENFQGGKVHFLSERVKGNYAFIKTNIISENRTIAVHYKLKREGKQWRVYDFLVQGVSMVRNYRFQFTKVIRQESFKGLLKRLEEQTA